MMLLENDVAWYFEVASSQWFSFMYVSESRLTLPICSLATLTTEHSTICLYNIKGKYMIIYLQQGNYRHNKTATTPETTNKNTSDNHMHMLVSLTHFHEQNRLGNVITRTTLVILQHVLPMVLCFVCIFQRSAWELYVQYFDNVSSVQRMEVPTNVSVIVEALAWTFMNQSVGLTACLTIAPV